MAHSQDKTVNLAIELQQFLDETMDGATDEVGDEVEQQAPEVKMTAASFEVRRDGLAYSVSVTPLHKYRGGDADPTNEVATTDD